MTICQATWWIQVHQNVRVMKNNRDEATGNLFSFLTWARSTSSPSPIHWADQ
jgi:hypothetical protein